MKMKYFLRYLKNNPLYALINTFGLAVSLMFVILLGDYSYRQFSIDRWHQNRDRIQLLSVTGSDLFSWPDATHALQERFPEIESVCCLNMHTARIKFEDRHSGGSDGEEGQGNVMVADSTFFRFFDFKFISGDRTTALDSPEKCVITESLARKLFPDRNPLGQPLNIVGSRYITINDGMGDPYDSTLVYTVSGVIKDLDRTVLLNSTELIASSARRPQILGYRLSGSTFVMGPLGSAYSFLMMAPGASPEDKKAEMTEFLKEQIPALDYFLKGNVRLELIPLDALMFSPLNDGSGILAGDSGLLKVLFSAVLAILLFAVTNYVNLTAANTGFRAKEVATRRLLGSGSRGISLEFIMESTLMVLLSFLIGFALALCFEDRFETLFDGKIDLLSDLSFGTVSACILFIVITGVISGIIPTLLLLKFKSIDIVKGSFRQSSKMVFSKIFIIIQNIITVTMLTASFTIYLQLNHLINAPLGHNVENLYIVTPDEDELIRSELEAQPFIRSIGTFGGSALDGCGVKMDTRKNRDMDYIPIYLFKCDSTYLALSGLKVLEDYHLGSDAKYVNKTLAAKADLEEGGREIVWDDGSTTQVAGIFSDYHMTNVLDPYKAAEMTLLPTEKIRYPSYLVLTDGSRDAYKKLCDLVRKVDGTSEELDWKVRGLEKDVEESFSDERSTMKLITLFTFIAVLISILGFIGMSLFFIRQRRKEIGVRRILGGTVGEILAMLLRKFCAPLLVSFVFAVPLSYFLMNRYLEGFDYRIGLSPLIFIATALMSLLIAVLSVVLQALHASNANPADSIRTE